MFDEQKDFSQWMADRRHQLTTKPEAATNDAVSEASPFKKFTDRPSADDIAAKIRAAMPAASPTAVAEPEVVAAPAEQPQQRAPLKLEQPHVAEQASAPVSQPVETMDVAPQLPATSDAFDFFHHATELFVENRIDVLRAKVSNSEATIRERLTARFGFGNEWRAFADRYLLDVVVGLERMKATQQQAG